MASGVFFSFLLFFVELFCALEVYIYINWDYGRGMEGWFPEAFGLSLSLCSG